MTTGTHNLWTSAGAVRLRRYAHVATVCALLLSTMGGCASVTNPVANGVPARLVPDELLAPSKNELKTIPLNWLAQPDADVYKLASGDILGVYIEGILGEPDQPPPINFPDVADMPPSVGYPFPIGKDGTVPLPLVDPIKVEGLTVDEARDEVIKAYTEAKKMLQPDEARVIINLVLPRRTKVLVIREDSTVARSANADVYNVATRAAPILSGRGQGSGAVLDLPPTENDVLNALARTGGLPGPNAANEVVIQRGFAAGDAWPTSANGDYEMPPMELNSPNNSPNGDDTSKKTNSGRRTIRIPLRWPEDEPPPFRPEDVVLRTGDIVFVPALDSETYFTGGVLPSREVPLPRDTDLRAIEAVLRVGGPFVNGGINGNNLSGGIIAAGIGNPSPSLLTVIRNTDDGRQLPIRVDLNRAARDPRENILIMDGDILVLQESPQEAVSRYFSQVFRLNFVGDLFRGTSGVGQATLSVP